MNDEAKKKLEEFSEGIKAKIAEAEKDAEEIETLAKEITTMAHSKSRNPHQMALALASSLGIGLGYCVKGKESVGDALISILPMIANVARTCAENVQPDKEIQKQDMSEKIKGLAIPMPGVGQA